MAVTRIKPPDFPNVLAVIMARAGSVGLPGKSLRPLLGKPVISYTFEHACQSKLITRTVVSSDDQQVLTLAKSAGLETIDRPPELSTATSATDPVLRHAIHSLYTRPYALYPFAVVMLYGNIPLRNNHIIDRSIQLFLDTQADSVQTVAPVGKFHPYWMFDLNDKSQITKYLPNNIYRRQDLPALYSPTGAVYVIKTQVLLAAEHSTDPHAFLGNDRRALVTAPDDSVDIDSEKDLYLAEAMLRTTQTQ